MTDTVNMPAPVPVPSDEDDIRQYLSEIRRYPLLTAQEEADLARRCMAGDEEAVRTMVNSNLRLVVSIAKEYMGRGVALPDLIQEGSIGLLVAVRKYDPSLSFRFSTYATKWIRQGVTRCLLNHAGSIRVPLHTAERMHKIEAVRAALRGENGQEPTPEMIAEKAGIPAQKVEALMRLNPEVCSLDIPAGDSEKATLGNLVEDLVSPKPEDALIRRELEDILAKLLSSLNAREQQILRLRFGMEDGVNYSLAQIAGMLGVSKERVRQLEKQAMERLIRLGARIGLEDFLE